MKENYEEEDKVKKGLELFKRDGGKLKDIASELDEKIDGLSNESPNGFGKIIWILALALFLLGLIAIVSYAGNKEEKLYNAHYAVIPDFTQNVERNIVENEIKKDAIKLYFSGEFSKVIKELESKKEPSNLELLYLAGAYLENSDPEKAIEILTQLSNSRYSDVASWYLALAYLKKGDETENLILELKRISNDNAHYKSWEAAEILNKIE